MGSRPIGFEAWVAKPFLITPSVTSPRHIGARIVAAFQAVASIPDRVGWVHATVAAEIGAASSPSDMAMLSAGNAIAAMMDRDAAFHDRNPYHNRQHFCEVMLSAHVLCQQEHLQAHEARCILLAALIHDLDHDGSANHGFEVERRSLARAAPFLHDAGVDAETCDALTALVLATEPRHGVAAAVAAHRAHVQGVPRIDSAPASTRAAAPELHLLNTNPTLAHAAVLLCEADVLPSVGLSAEHAMHLQERLSQEWGRPLGTVDKLQFLDDVVNAGVIGPFFMPNLVALRESLVRCPDAADC